VFEGPGGLYWTLSDGAGKPQQLTRSTSRQIPFSFAPDGTRLAFFEFSINGSNIWTLPVTTGGADLSAGKPQVFLQDKFVQRHPAFPPDGKWLAHSSNESARSKSTCELSLRKVGNGKSQIAAVCTPNGRATGANCFFRNNDSQIMVAPYTVKGDSFMADKPHVWSQTKLADPGFNGINYHLAADGKRVAALMPAFTPEGDQSQSRAILLENFFDELRRRVPVSK